MEFLGSSRLSAAALWVILLAQGMLQAETGEVSYDGTSLIIDGERKIIMSGSVHYPRSTPDMWEGLIDKAQGGGLDCIDTYVFWNLHEPQQGQYDFEGRLDLVRFLKLVESKGLYVTLRIGPYIESEWNFGGIPLWLRDIPGIVFRTDNEPFKREMQRFVTKIVQMLQAENLFASQGGPIILSQACLGRSECKVALSDFGGDGCIGISKSLAVEATCS